MTAVDRDTRLSLPNDVRRVAAAITMTTGRCYDIIDIYVIHRHLAKSKKVISAVDLLAIYAAIKSV